MIRIIKHTLLFASIILLGLFTPGPLATAQTGDQRVLMTDMHIFAELGTDCVTKISIKTTLKNIGSTDLDTFDIRIDVRGLSVKNASLDGVTVETVATAVDNFMIITVHPDITIPVNSSSVLFLNFTTQCLQEQIGLNSDRTMYINHLIYYFRPLNEVKNLTFAAALPAHSVLHLDAAAPLYPNPISNHTDGTRIVYVWQRELLRPGQEIVHIVKYLMPAALIDRPASAAASESVIIWIVTIIVVVSAVLLIERIPLLIRRLRSKEIIVSGKISSQEQEILDLLSTRGGSCSQREIYENLDMSQSMTSMMLTSLEGRGLIKRLRSGRENIVHIMET